MSPHDKPLVWIIGKDLVKTPPLSYEARIELGFLLRCVQKGIKLSLPESRPMPSIGKHCHELRVNDKDCTWRLVYYIDTDAIVILDFFKKKTEQTPQKSITTCKDRLKNYNAL